jgi:site-specific recombinase XerC
MTNPYPVLVRLTTVYGTKAIGKPPRRRPNAETRSREYLTEAEVERLIKAAGDNRNGHRDATMILVAYRHGLRAAEVVALRWDAVDFGHSRLHADRPRAAGSAAPTARAGAQVDVRVHVKSRFAVHDRRLSQDGGAAWCRRQARLSRSSAHAQARLWF